MKDEPAIRARLAKLEDAADHGPPEDYDLNYGAASALRWVLDKGEIVDPKQVNLGQEGDIRW